MPKLGHQAVSQLHIKNTIKNEDIIFMWISDQDSMNSIVSNGVSV